MPDRAIAGSPRVRKRQWEAVAIVEWSTQKAVQTERLLGS
jgi:hypothetical protein